MQGCIIYHVHEHCQRHQHGDLQGHLLPGVWGKIESKHSHADKDINDNLLFILKIVDKFELNEI